MRDIPEDLRDALVVPALFLGIVGGLELSYGGLFGAFNLLLAGVGVVANIALAVQQGFDEVMDGAMIAMHLWTFLVKVVQILIQLGLVAGGALAIRGAHALYSLSDRDRVLQGAGAVVIGPFVLLLSNVLALCALNPCGLFCGAVLPLGFTFLGGMAAIVAYNTVSRAEVIIAFETLEE